LTGSQSFYSVVEFNILLHFLFSFKELITVSIDCTDQVVRLKSAPMFVCSRSYTLHLSGQFTIMKTRKGRRYQCCSWSIYNSLVWAQQTGTEHPECRVCFPKDGCRWWMKWNLLWRMQPIWFQSIPLLTAERWCKNSSIHGRMAFIIATSWLKRIKQRIIVFFLLLPVLYFCLHGEGIVVCCARGESLPFGRFNQACRTAVGF